MRDTLAMTGVGRSVVAWPDISRTKTRIFVVLFNVHPGSARFEGATTGGAKTESSRTTSGALL